MPIGVRSRSCADGPPGNPLKPTPNQTGCPGAILNLSLSVNGDNHITNSGFSYDAAGDMTDDGNHSYTYDAEGHITAVDSGTTATYTYDGDGNRVEKSTGTLYWYGTDGQVLDETNLSGSLTSQYVYFSGQRIARRDGSGNVYYYGEDALSSSRAIVESGQTSLCFDADFYPFGRENDFTSSWRVAQAARFWLLRVPHARSASVGPFLLVPLQLPFSP
jgi:hypothetical protein